MKIKIAAALTLAHLISGCGGGGGSEPLSTGEFLDSAVMGLNYQTASQSGSTNAQGQFNYRSGESVRFAIGDIEFPAVAAQGTVTPLEVFATEDLADVSVVNMLRLLQSLDVDGDASNGIEISDLTHQLAAGLNLDFAAADFDISANNLIASSGGANASLIDAAQASMHFSQTLEQINGTCSSDHAMVGYRGEFRNYFHDIAGVATIVDDCTIEIEMFNYDGGGPAVYFYGAQDHQYASDQAFAIGDEISGRAYNGEAVRLTLPAGKSLDDLNGISVWCVAFGANFGDLEFVAP